MFSKLVMRWVVFGVTLCIAACSKPAPPGAAPPVEVTVVTISAQDAANLVTLPGRVEAIRSAEVRARVDGVIQQLLYSPQR